MSRFDREREAAGPTLAESRPARLRLSPSKENGGNPNRLVSSLTPALPNRMVGHPVNALGTLASADETDQGSASEQTSGPRSEDRAARKGRADAFGISRFLRTVSQASQARSEPVENQGGVARLNHDAALDRPGRDTPRTAKGALASLPKRMGLEVGAR